MADKKYLFCEETGHGVLVSPEPDHTPADVAAHNSVVRLFSHAHHGKLLMVLLDQKLAAEWNHENAESLYRDVTGTNPPTSLMHLGKPEKDEKLEIWRLGARHFYRIFFAGAIGAVLFMLSAYPLTFAVKSALAFFPLLVAGWYFSTPDQVHGQPFRKLSKVAQWNTIFRLVGLAAGVVVYMIFLRGLNP